MLFLNARIYFSPTQVISGTRFIWRMKNLDALLKARGIREGKTVHIGDMVFEWHE